jgi:high-affinity iron transporter
VAVVREGLELALFLNAVVLHSAASTVLAGAMLGLLVAAACGWVLFATTLRFSVRRFFQVSGALLLLLAAGFVSHAVGEFIEVGWIPPLIEPIWNTTGWLPETSTGGAILKTLFGYESTPSLAEVAAYVLFLLAVGWALRRSRATIKPSGESILTAVAGRELSQQASEPRKSQAVCGGR